MGALASGIAYLVQAEAVPPPSEVIVVADGDTDGSWLRAQEFGAKVLRIPLLHHYVHQTACEQASTFWGACGAIRREVFL